MAKVQKTEGIVLSSDIGSGQSRYKASSGGYHYRTSYFPDISYRYTVNGQEYTNKRFAQRPSMINRKFMIHRIIDKYPVGASVPVYYHADDPANSYLQSGYGKIVTFMVLAAVVVIIVVLVLIIALAAPTM